MKFIEIEVECYSGGRADETPRRISVNGDAHLVTRLFSESVERLVATRQEVRRYRVLTDRGMVLEIIRLDDGTWVLVSLSPT